VVARALIRVAAQPTLDYVYLGGRLEARPGGPGVYAAAAAAVLGAEVRLEGGYGYCGLSGVEAEARLGARRAGRPWPGRGPVFILAYSPGGDRAYSVASRPAPMWPLEAGSLASPLYGEVPPLAPPGGPLAALDAQGLARAGYDGVPRGAAVAVHYSRGELARAPPVPVAVETDGYGPMRVFSWGRLECVASPRGRRVADPTGAGDAFTLALTFFLGRGLDACGAAEEASRVVPEALGLAREVLSSVEPVGCEADCRPRVVLFDLDGTIVDTMGAYTGEAARIISRYSGLSECEARLLYERTKGMAFADQLRAAGVRGDSARRAVEEFARAKKALLAGLEPPEAVTRLVEALRRLGLRAAVSTNNECSVIARIRWLREIFDAVLCYDAAQSKGAAHLWRILAEFNAEPCQVIFVGDADYDVETYTRLGVPALKTRGLWDPAEAINLLETIKSLLEAEDQVKALAELISHATQN